MPPTSLLGWVKSHLTGEEEKVVVLQPPISIRTASLLLVVYTIFYVAPFYVSKATRPSPLLSRDAPSVIRGRIAAVTTTCILCSTATFGLLSTFENVVAGKAGNPILSLHLMGWFPIGIVDAARAVALTVILFAGPLFEAAIVEGAWKDWIRLRGLWEVVGSWIGYRNMIAGPITEEVLFRSAAVPLFLVSRCPPSQIIYTTPIIFGLAHIHHYYEFRLTHPHTPPAAALARSVLQFSYTTLFGAYATFLYLRSGSLLAVVLVHAFCNWMGLPRFWGRVGVVEGAVEPVIGGGAGKRDEGGKPGAATAAQTSKSNGSAGILWTVAYYIILVAGAYGFYKQFWTLTDGENALAIF